MLPISPVEQLREALPVLLERVSFAEAEVEAVTISQLEFHLRDHEQKVWHAHYNPETGAVSGHREREQAGNGTSFRQFLLNLHKSRGYPDFETNTRSVWAMAVDAMSFTMIFWGISGIVMWWQIKRTRLVGGVCLMLSLTAALWVGFEMHSLITGA